ncbi:DUF3180 domain-containing protein [Nocardioides marmoriginsengisoli]|uniref:DUF3180 domain-containing protein n=1 Tax=Nocardioides marmoriginsengisoli TaxID=661483 RepID=A0A3N0CFJ1_9ACTN|nr:DUF3180 domain-containing protein [Nocardioides marmoriginsengisoli]RNL62224.1 DUF3180 domain-containing protein [Nocardioides marmoriginsengisoli]
MTRDQPPLVEPDEPEPSGHIEPTGPGPLVVLGSIGLVAGWAARGIAIRNGSPTPVISWTAVAVVWFVMAVTAGTAYLTWRTVHRERRRLTAQQGVRRLALGKTIDRLAALALGGSIGMLISTIGASGNGADVLALRAIAAAVGAAAAVAAGLLLEHACRVPPAARGDLR